MVTLGGVLVTSFVSYAFNAAIQGRWRDVIEGGPPALLLGAGFVWGVPREWRRIREMWERGE
jgi:hypothetical protein